MKNILKNSSKIVALCLGLTLTVVFVACEKTDTLPQEETQVEQRFNSVSSEELEAIHRDLGKSLENVSTFSDNTSSARTEADNVENVSLGTEQTNLNIKGAGGVIPLTAYSINRNSFSGDSRYNAVLELDTRVAVANFAVAYKDKNGKYVYVANSGYNRTLSNPVQILGFNKSLPITFNVSTIEGVSGAIPKDADKVYFLVQGLALNAKYTIKIYRRSLNLNVGFITQNGDTKFCGHTCFEMDRAYLWNRNPSFSSYVPPSKNNCDSKKEPITISDWLNKNYPNQSYCLSGGNGTNPLQVKKLSQNFSDAGRIFSDVIFASSKSYGSTKPDINLDSKNALSVLWQELAYGYPVIVQVHIKFNKSEGTHWMLLTGIDNDAVYLNDPGTQYQYIDYKNTNIRANSIGYNRKVSLSIFKSDWEHSDNNRNCVIIHGGSKQR